MRLAERSLELSLLSASLISGVLLAVPFGGVFKVDASAFELSKFSSFSFSGELIQL